MPTDSDTPEKHDDAQPADAPESYAAHRQHSHHHHHHHHHRHRHRHHHRHSAGDAGGSTGGGAGGGGITNYELRITNSTTGTAGTIAAPSTTGGSAADIAGGSHSEIRNSQFVIRNSSGGTTADTTGGSHSEIRNSQFVIRNSSAGTAGAAAGWRDRAIALFAALSLVESVVYIGAMPLLALYIAFGLAAGAFAMLFLPFGFDGVSLKVTTTLKRLVRFPLFWLGVLLLGYMAIQGLNPNWHVVFRSFYYRVLPLKPDEFVAWLPTGVDAPALLERENPGGMNAFRQMLVFGTPWLLLCALWCGVKSKRALAAVGWAVLVTMLGVVAWGGQMRIAGTQKLLGFYNLGNFETSFFATFLYQNQAAAWLSLTFGAAIALGVWHWENARKTNAGSGPHLLCGAFALWVTFGIVFVLSFGGFVTVALQLFLGVPVAIIWALVRRGANRNVIIGGIITSVLIGLLAFTFCATADFSKIENKLSRKFHLAETNRIDNREPIRRAALLMAEHTDKRGKEYIWTGWGAGSFRWVSPKFFRQVPETRHKRYNYAHCDWLQMLCEWGVAGTSIVAVAFFWAVAWFLRNIRRWTPATFPLLLAIVLFMAHAAFDFLIYSVPILSLVALLVVLAGRLSLAPLGSSKFKVR